MKVAIKVKFDQHDYLKQELLKNEGKCLVECNPFDKFWSCGLKLNDQKALSPSNWVGENRLGHCLDDVRRLLQ